MNGFLKYIRRTVAIIDACCLVIFTILSLINGVDIDISFSFNVLMCFWFSIILLRNSWCDGEQVWETRAKKKSWIYSLIFAGVFLSIIKIHMFYEEIVRNRSGMSCVIAAIASYTLFDSAYKYITRVDKFYK